MSHWSDEYLFKAATCPCSLRSAEEEEKYGSYCEDCWKIISKTCRCHFCLVKVEKKRLYISYAESGLVLCKSCWMNYKYKI